MNDALHLLSDRERAVLRLLAAGHDAKSAARRLDLSVHTINERLRAARRTLGVSSSRQAARLLAEAEGSTAQEIRSETFGVGRQQRLTAGPDRAGRCTARHVIATLSIGGSVVTAALIAVLLQATPTIVSPADAQAPQVAATAPAPGSTIAPGRFVLSVTFDRPMRAASYSFVQASAATYPDCAARPVVSPDRRTFALRCKAIAGQRYEIWFNRGRFTNFRSASGIPARAHRLIFDSR